MFFYKLLQPHACNICDKRFIQPIALKKHLKVHNKQALRLTKNTQIVPTIAALNS